MTSKILPLMVLFTLLIPGLAIGYWDLAVESVNVETADPIVGDTVNMNATIRNLGNESVPSGATGQINISYGDGDSTALSLPPLDPNEETYLYQTHTYNSAEDYTFTVTINASEDNNATNDEDFIIFTVRNLEYDFSGTDYSFSLLSGQSETMSGNVTNTGDMDAEIQLQATNLEREDGSETIDMSSAVFPSSKIPLRVGRTYDDVEITVATDSNQMPGTYTGNLQVVNLDNNDEITDIGNITATVTNDAPVVDVTDQVVVVGEEFTYDVSEVSSDPEGDDLTYGLVSGPESMTMSDDGMLSGWTPTSTTSRSVTVNVSDGFSTTEKTFTVESIQNVPSIEFQSEDVTIGGSNADRGDTYTETLTLENDGAQTITDLEVEAVSTSGSELDEDYEASVSVGTSTLQPGETTTATLSMTIPEDATARERRVGKLKASGQGDSSSVSANADILMQAESMLRIDEVELEIDGDTDEVDDGDDYDVKIDDEVTLTVTLENRYSSSDDIELEDAYFLVEDMEDWDIDETSSKKDIRENDDKTFEVTFTIPDDAEEDDVELFIEAFAEDEEHDFEHYDDFSFDLSIEKESHEISIDSWDFSRNPVDCNDRNVDLDVTLKNIGENDEDEVMLNIVSDSGELDWHKRIRDISIDEGDSETESVTISLPDDLEEGSYFVELDAYYDNDELSDEETIYLDVVCGTGSDDGSTGDDSNGEDDGVEVTNPDDSDGTPGQPVPNPVQGEEVSTLSNFRTSTGYMVLLIVVAVGLLVAIGYLLYGVANPPKRK